MHGGTGDEAGTGRDERRQRRGRHRAPEPPPVVPPLPPAVVVPPLPPPASVHAPFGGRAGERHEPPRPGRWLAWVLAGFVVAGGGLVAGYTALGGETGSSGTGPTMTTTAGTTPSPPASGSDRSGAAAAGSLPAPVVPPCDGSYVLVVGSVTTPVGHEEAVARLLDATPGSRWFTTEGTCGSLSERSDDGTLIHAVYLGPFPTAEAALASCPAGPPDAYAKRLDDGAGTAGSVVPCG